MNRILIIILVLIILIVLFLFIHSNSAPTISVQGRNPPPKECEPNQFMNLCCTLYNFDPINIGTQNTQQAVYCPNTNTIKMAFASECSSLNPLCPVLNEGSQTCPLFTPSADQKVYIYTIMVDNQNDVSKFYLTFDSNSNSVYLSNTKSTIFNYNSSISTKISNTNYYLVIDSTTGIVSLNAGLFGQIFNYNCGVLYTSPGNKMLTMNDSISSDNKINLGSLPYDPNNLNNPISFYFELIS